MEITRITQENIEDYADLIPGDIAENIEREFYRGIAVRDDETKTANAAMIWEFEHLLDKEQDTRSRLSWLYHDGSEAGVRMFHAYEEDLRQESAVSSSVFLKKKDSAEKGLLKEQRFSFSEKESQDLVVTIADLKTLDIAKKTATPAYIKSLDKILVRSFRRGIMNCLLYAKRNLLEDLSSLTMTWFEQKVSCYVETDGKANGFLLVHKTVSGDLRVETLAGFGPDARKNLVYMIRYAICKADEIYPPQTKVILPRRDATAENLAAYFFPGKRGEDGLFGEREEC